VRKDLFLSLKTRTLVFKKPNGAELIKRVYCKQVVLLANDLILFLIRGFYLIIALIL